MKGTWRAGRTATARGSGNRMRSQASDRDRSDLRLESLDGDAGGAASQSSSKAANPAVWGFIGVVVGSILTGGLSLIGLKISADQAAEQARTEFLRSQRLEMYSSAVTDVQTFIVDADRYGETAQRLGNGQEAAAALSAAEGSYQEAVGSIWNVRMIAPEELRTLNQQVGQLADCMHSSLTDGYHEGDAEYLDSTGNRINRLVSDFSDYALLEFDSGVPTPEPVVQGQGVC